MVSHTKAEERPMGKDSVSRRSFLAALLAGVAVAALPVAEPTEAEAQERQFTTFHHERRHTRHPRRRGWRRRVARVHRRGPTKPREDVAPPQ